MCVCVGGGGGGGGEGVRGKCVCARVLCVCVCVFNRKNDAGHTLNQQLQTVGDRINCENVCKCGSMYIFPA